MVGDAAAAAVAAAASIYACHNSAPQQVRRLLHDTWIAVWPRESSDGLVHGSQTFPSLQTCSLRERSGPRQDVT